MKSLLKWSYDCDLNTRGNETNKFVFNLFIFANMKHKQSAKRFSLSFLATHEIRLCCCFSLNFILFLFNFFVFFFSTALLVVCEWFLLCFSVVNMICFFNFFVCLLAVYPIVWFTSSHVP